MHVALVGCGLSCKDYLYVAESRGGRSAFCDEVWAVKTLGTVFDCDRIFHMDDMRVQEARAQAGDEKKAAMIAWMKKHPGPIYTSVVRPEYPGMVEYPLEDVLNAVGTPYFNSTVAYAICYAIYLGVTRLSVFGCDFSYPSGLGLEHEAEAGRGCCEYWLGRAMQRGMEVHVTPTSTLLDADVKDKFYGYDALKIDWTIADGKYRLKKTPREITHIKPGSPASCLR